MKLLLISALTTLLLFSNVGGYDRQSWYSDEVSVLDANKELMDVYHKLTKHRIIVDSLGERTDTLECERDTLHNRIDSITTDVPDSVFYAYDAGGAQTITDGNTDPITIDTEVKEDGIYVHAADDYAVAINSDGWYRVTAQATVSSVNRLASAAEMYLYDYSGSWAAISGAYEIGMLPVTVTDVASLRIDVFREFTSGDSVAIYIKATSDNMVTVANTVRLLIEKIH